MCDEQRTDITYRNLDEEKSRRRVHIPEYELDEAKDILKEFVAWFNADLSVSDIEEGQSFASQALDLNSIVNKAEAFLKFLQDE